MPILLGNIWHTDQNKNIITENKVQISTEKEQNVVFHDENIGYTVDLTTSMPPAENLGLTPGVTLGDFLSRPVLISTLTWNETDSIYTELDSFNPWYEFFNKPEIKYKINNFSFIRCKLRLKVLINASQFYYGAAAYFYTPLPSFSPQNLTIDAPAHYLVTLSQRPHMWVYPTSNQGCEMVLPFLWPADWLRVQYAADFTAMGNISLINFTLLQSANAAVGVGVTMQVYAWAEDVELSGPSIGLSMQGGDEYGIISGPASALAKVTESMGKIPIIGKYAQASTIGLKAVSSIASMFGFTNTPVIEDIKPLQPRPFPMFASPEISFPVEKLSIDPKNELSIDPSIVGASPVDELVISNICMKESYLYQEIWSSTDAVDTVLTSMAVSPNLFQSNSFTNSETIYPTPVALVNNLFLHWRGDIIYRFKFIASQYHKGRIRITYDPTGYLAMNSYSNPDNTTTVFNTIVDLGSNTDVEIRVPYHQRTSWLRTLPSESAFQPVLHSFNYDGNYHNGTLTVRVLTKLTAPVATSSINMLVFVRGADNLEFANPRNLGGYVDGEDTRIYTFYDIQGSDEYEDDSERQREVAGNKVTIYNPSRYLINFGEQIVSLRQLFHRYQYLGSYQIHPPSGSVPSNLLFTHSRFPISPGFDPKGITQAITFANPLVGAPFNFVKMLPVAFIMPAFLGVRGSMMWSYNLDTSISINRNYIFRNLGATRITKSVLTQSLSYTAFTAITAATSSAAAAISMKTKCGGAAGLAITNELTQNGLNVCYPHYSRFKFQSTSPNKTSDFLYASIDDEANLNAYCFEMGIPVLSSTDAATRLEQYCATGPDFSLNFFLSAPMYHVITSNVGAYN